MFDICRAFAKMSRKIFLTKIHMSNDFLVKVKEAEKKAAEMIAKSLDKKQDDLLKYKQDLAKNEEMSLKEAQEKMRAELQKSKTASRKDYEEKVAEGDLDIKKMKSDKLNMLDGLMVEAGSLFLANL